jgi:hypothetical protein
VSEKIYKIKFKHNNQVVFVGESVGKKILKKEEFVTFNGLYKYENETDSLYKRCCYNPGVTEIEIEEVSTEEMIEQCSN